MKFVPSWLKTALKETREFFWPLIDEDEPNQDLPQTPLELKITKANLKKAFDLKQKIAESENDRRSSIETKAALFISTISVTTSIVVAANTLSIDNNENQNAIKLSVIISFVLTIYTVRTVWFSVKALERKGYHVIGIDDINIPGNEEEYNRAMLLNLAEKTKKNEAMINEKVDNLVLAQAYYKRAIIVICIYALAVLVYCLFFKKNSAHEPVFKPQYVELQRIKQF